MKTPVFFDLSALHKTELRGAILNSPIDFGLVANLWQVLKEKSHGFLEGQPIASRMSWARVFSRSKGRAFYSNEQGSVVGIAGRRSRCPRSPQVERDQA